MKGGCTIGVSSEGEGAMSFRNLVAFGVICLGACSSAPPVVAPTPLSSLFEDAGYVMFPIPNARDSGGSIVRLVPPPFERPDAKSTIVWVDSLSACGFPDEILYTPQSRNGKIPNYTGSRTFSASGGLGLNLFSPIIYVDPLQCFIQQ